MDRDAAKELLNIKTWLRRIDEIVLLGKDAYLADELLQEAGDSLMMKLGETSRRLARLGVPAPGGVDWTLAIANRNFLIHQYDQISRELTWLTLARDLPAWRSVLNPLFDAAFAALAMDGPSGGSAGRL
ncbi:MAG: DUF86 domain-containing protein [Micrococcales bacterium]|nr:DUF86 domain-containing protein [Micrococcales bacterium]